MRAILILMDSLNRRFLESYQKHTWVKTPNMNRLSERSAVFDYHFVGSAPCMPARHDILTGRLDFLERNWSGIQPYDFTLTEALKCHGIYSHMITDHYHYFHTGGENYPFIFDSWDFVRGQEHDALVPKIGQCGKKEHYGQYHLQYELNRQTFLSESAFPGPRTFEKAVEFVEQYHHEDNFFLMIDSFDPHEPFDVPDDFAEQYDDTYNDKLFYWPDYSDSAGLPEQAVTHIKKQYAKTLTLSDKWLGRLFDTFDKYNMWDDTMIILTTDHGYMLDEHKLLGKNYMPAYNEVYHIPLFIHMPGQTEQRRIKGLSQNIDLFPTLLEYFGIKPDACPDKLHGKSLWPVLENERESVRDYALYGVFGKQVNITDGRYTYFRSAAREDNMPLHIYTAFPTTINHYWDRKHIKDVGKIETGRFLKWTNYPVFKIAADNVVLEDVSHRFDVRYEILKDNMLFDMENDYGQMNNLAGSDIEKDMVRLLKKALLEHDSPSEQWERLGLACNMENT